MPVSLVLLAALLILFALITPARFNTAINPGSVRVPPFTPTPTALPRPTDVHGGDIVFTCTRKDVNQICLIKADGTGYRQLTDGTSSSYYPAISPDGEAVIFATNKYDYFDMFKLMLHLPDSPQSAQSAPDQLTVYIGNAFSPSFSPDGRRILFVNKVGDGPSALWMMDADGKNARVLYSPPRNIVGAAWAPDGVHIAFTMAMDSIYAYQVFLLDLSRQGSEPKQISRGLYDIGGSLAWSRDQSDIVIFAGPAAAREIFRLDVASGTATQLTFGGNNASPAYSPDGQYIVFNSLRNQGQADLYVMRADGHSMRQLTTDLEPDWQPEWGP